MCDIESSTILCFRPIYKEQARLWQLLSEQKGICCSTKFGPLTSCDCRVVRYSTMQLYTTTPARWWRHSTSAHFTGSGKCNDEDPCQQPRKWDSPSKGIWKKRVYGWINLKRFVAIQGLFDFRTLCKEKLTNEESTQLKSTIFYWFE